MALSRFDTGPLRSGLVGSVQSPLDGTGLSAASTIVSLVQPGVPSRQPMVPFSCCEYRLPK